MGTADLTQGKVVLINGTSSSGKSSLARSLQTLLSTENSPFFHVEADLLRDMHPKRKLTKDVAMPSLLAAIPPSLAVLAAHGNNLIIDDVFGGGQVRNYAEAFTGFDVLFVGVRCSLPILEARERARGDRQIGTAQGLERMCHAHGLYDLEVDTSLYSPEQAAQIVKVRWENGPAPDALRRLRETLPR